MEKEHKTKKVTMAKKPASKKFEYENNPMREIKIEKVVLSVGATGDALAKGVKLLEVLTKRTPKKTTSNKRIPTLGVRPGLEMGAVVTIRKDVAPLLNKLLVAVDNTIRRRQIAHNHFSFGIKEYLEIPGVEYQRDVGIMGLDVTVVFKRSGRRVALRKIKKGTFPKIQGVFREEIIKFMEEKFNTNFIGKL